MKANFLQYFFFLAFDRLDIFSYEERIVEQAWAISGIEKLRQRKWSIVIFCSFFKVPLREDSPLREKYFLDIISRYRYFLRCFIICPIFYPMIRSSNFRRCNNILSRDILSSTKKTGNFSPKGKQDASVGATKGG